MHALFITVGLLLSMVPGLAPAKQGGGDDCRSAFYGIIQQRPQGRRQGGWVIGGRTFITDQGTEYDETEGLLSVGSCAKAQIRDSRVHEIDSEPMQDCQ